MNLLHGNRSRHRRVIDESGRELDDTVRFPRLHALSEIVLHRPDRDDDASHLLHDGGTRLIPVPGGRSMAMRVRSAPAMQVPNTGPDDLSGVRFMPFTIQPLARSMPQRMLLARDFVRLGFQMAARELDQMVKVLSSGWRKLAAENDHRFVSLDAHLARVVSEHNAWCAALDGRSLAEAYAEGGTERLQKLTPQVLAAMDARAKEMAR